MILVPIIALAMAAELPKPLTESQNREIGCVAVIALIAEDQRRKAPGADDYPDVQKSGRRWTGIVGDRITFESGHAKEDIAAAMRAAIKTEQQAVMNTANPKAIVRARMADCLPLMRADLTKDTAAR